MMMDRQAKERHQTLQLILPATTRAVPDTEKLPSEGVRVRVYVRVVPASWSEQPKSAITEVEVADNDWNQLIYIN